MTPDERLEALLNRAGQTISDLPKGDGRHLVYDKELRKSADAAQMKWHGIRTDSLIDVVDGLNMALDYILHLTDVIDRLEQALENQVTLHENLIHVICNADIPESVDYEDFSLVVDSIYKAVQLAQEGWEAYEAGAPEDWSVDDSD